MMKKKSARELKPSGSKAMDDSLQTLKPRLAALGLGSGGSSQGSEPRSHHVNGPTTEGSDADVGDVKEEEEGGEEEKEKETEEEFVDPRADPLAGVSAGDASDAEPWVKDEPVDEGDLHEYSFALDNPPPDFFDEDMATVVSASTAKGKEQRLQDAEAEVKRRKEEREKSAVLMNRHSGSAAVYARLNGSTITVDPLADPAEEFDRLISYNEFLAAFNVHMYTTTDRVYNPHLKLLSKANLINATVHMFMSAGYLSRIRDRSALERHALVDMLAASQAAYHLLVAILKRRQLNADPRVVDPPPHTVATAKKLVLDATGLAVEDLHHLRREADQKDKEIADLREELARNAAETERVKRGAEDSANPASKATREGVRLQSDEEMVDESGSSEFGDAISSVKSASRRSTRAPGGRRSGSARRSEKSSGPIGSRRDRNKAKPWWQGMKAGDKSDSDCGSDIFESYEPLSKEINATRIRQSSVADLKPFADKEKSESRARSWLSDVKAAYRRDEMTADEKCMHFPTLLKGPPKNWYRQLDRHEKGTWIYLLEAFQKEYCGEDTSPLHKYYALRRWSNEDHIEYLYRLNAQAKRAGKRYKAGQDGKEHVDQYLISVEDKDLVRTLTPLCIQNVDALKEVLVAMRKS